MQRWIPMFLLAALTSACFSVGMRFPTDRVSEIRNGVTTRAQIQSEFGSPWRTGIEDGEETWTYGRYLYALGSPARTADLKIRFDHNGVVSSHTFSTTNPGP